MTAPLDENALAEARKAVGTIPGAALWIEVEKAIRAYLAASPSPSMEMEVVRKLRYRVNNPSAWPEGFDQSASDLMAEAADVLSQAQSALAAMRAERDEAIERGYEWFNLAQDYKAIVLDAEARLKALEEQVEADAKALDEAAVEVQSWGAYAGEYFQDKHDLEGCCRTITRQATAARTAIKENAP